MLSEQEIEELKGKAEKATPGPWEYAPSHTCAPRFAVTNPRGEAELGTYEVADRIFWDTNADFIAAANPRTILSLISALEEARATNDELWRDIDRVNKAGRREFVRAEAAEAALKEARHALRQIGLRFGPTIRLDDCTALARSTVEKIDEAMPQFVSKLASASGLPRSS